MKQYLDLCKKVLDTGIMKKNRTGINHLGIQGDMMKFDLSQGFPAVTTKELAFKTCVAEMLGFLRGYDNARKFRSLGCKVWDANANENEQWLKNGYRKGTDDLGRIYGVQARDWRITKGSGLNYSGAYDTSDQLRNVYEDLKVGKDNRREIITHWNPGETDQMALPPCHLLYQFGIEGDKLNLAMYQRSCDMPLGVPFNIAGYAWLLSVMAHITGLKVGTFTHFLFDIHIYENQIEGIKEQLSREPLNLPMLWINPEIQTLEDLETWVTVGDFKLIAYQHHPAIKFPFAV